MKFDDILALAKAGFKAEDILRVYESEKVSETAKNTEPPISTTNEPSDMLTHFASITKQLETLTAAVQANNIINTNQEAPKNENADDALAALIAR